MARFDSYVTDNATVGSFINTRYSGKGADMDVQMIYSGTTGSCVLLVRTA